MFFLRTEVINAPHPTRPRSLVISPIFPRKGDISRNINIMRSEWQSNYLSAQREVEVEESWLLQPIVSSVFVPRNGSNQRREIAQRDFSSRLLRSRCRELARLSRSESSQSPIRASTMPNADPASPIIRESVRFLRVRAGGAAARRGNNRGNALTSSPTRESETLTAITGQTPPGEAGEGGVRSFSIWKISYVTHARKGRFLAPFRL